MMLPIIRIGKVMKVTSASSKVERDEDDDDADERQHAREQRHDAVRDEAVERLHVVGHARDQDPGPAPGEEADRHLLQVHVDALAQILQHALADPADEVGLRVGGRPVGGDRADEDGDDDRQCRLVSLSDAAVDRPPGEIGRRQR